MIEHILVVGLTFTEGMRGNLGVWARNAAGQPRVWGECLNVRGSKDGPYLTGSLTELITSCFPEPDLPSVVPEAVRVRLQERGMLGLARESLQTPLLNMFRAVGKALYPLEDVAAIKQVLRLVVGHVVRVDFDRGRPAMHDHAIRRSELDGATTWAEKPLSAWIEHFEGTPGCHKILGLSSQMRAMIESGKAVELEDDDDDESDES